MFAKLQNGSTIDYYYHYCYLVTKKTIALDLYLRRCVGDCARYNTSRYERFSISILLFFRMEINLYISGDEITSDYGWTGNQNFLFEIFSM